MCFFQTFFSDTAVGLSEGVADFGHYIDAFEVLDQHVVGLKAEAQPAAEAEAPAKPKRRTTKKAAVAEPVAEAAVAPVPEAAPVEAVVQEPVAAASAQPVLVEAGGDDTAPKKRGWWRR